MENIVIATFGDTSAALQGLRELELLDEAGNLRLRNAAVVERGRDGTWRIADEAEELAFGATVAGGLLGTLVGVLTGPLGLLLGEAAGLMADEAIDVTEDETRELLHEAMIRRVPPGTTALVGDVEEPVSHPLDDAMAKLGAQMTRWPREGVQAELEGAAEATEASHRASRRMLPRHKAEARQG
jgi:uncharacterized membrane protein